MFFKNLQIYRLNGDLSAGQMLAALTMRQLPEICASNAAVMGWIAPRENGDLMHRVNGQWLLSLAFDQKLLPTAIVRQFANDKAKDIEANEGRKVGRREMRELREATLQELLPRAFVRRRVTHGWIDPVNGWLCVDAASPGKGEEFVEFVRKTVDGIKVSPLKLLLSPTAAMTHWVASGEAPTGFTVDRDLELKSAEDATVRYKNHALEGEEIARHVASGKHGTKLGMTWNDRISFVLAEPMQIKRLQFLDVVKESAIGAENEAEQFDAEFALMAGELAALLTETVTALGGEAPC